MEWREDVRPAKGGDTAARERLREYLTPFVHGACLAHAPHHLTESILSRVLDEALASLATTDDADVGVHVMNVARQHARQAARGQLDEQTVTDPTLNDARQVLSRLRALPEPTRERLILRLVEGIPGPELAEVARLNAAELRAELERGAAELARALGQAQSFAGDDYLWSLGGTPHALFARLEMQLPVLRFDPTAAPLPPVPADVAGTMQDLKPVGSLGGPMKKLKFDDAEHTSVGELGTEPGVLSVAPPRAAPPGPNPFEPQVRTIAATDLPAEARASSLAQVPWEDPSPSVKLPPRPVPAVREGRENSGKSGSNKSGRQQVVVGETSSKSGKMAPLGPRAETKEAELAEPETTEAKVPALVLAQQAASSPEAMLGRPTMEMPLGSVIAAPETRIQPIPAPLNLHAELDEETAVAQPRAARPPPPGPLDAPLFKGSTPLFAAGVLIGAALLVYSASLFATERQAKSQWTLTQVVVAAEDLQFGDIINIDSVALRSVPPEYATVSVVKADAINSVLDQRILANVQTGDPLFYTQFASTLSSSRLSERISKRGRGFTIPVSTQGAVGRWVHPGDTVDVILGITGAEGGKGSKEPRAVTLLQHVRVLATGLADNELSEKALDERAKQYSDVTLLLTPEESEVLALSTALGKLHLTLRTEEDDEVDLERGYTNAQTLLDGKRRQALLKRRSDVVRVIRNTPSEPAREGKRR